MIPSVDILGLGSVALDEILRVNDWPPADAKRRVLNRERRLGGLTGHALAAASAFGARCGYGGRLGTDEDSTAVRAALESQGIDTAVADIGPDNGVVRSVIIASASTSTRNVFSMPAARTGAPDAGPSEVIIRAARVLFIDHHGITGNLRAVRIAREVGIPVVADFERDDHPDFRELLGAVDHLILSREFALRITGTKTPADAASQLWNSERQVVIVTCGEQGCWVKCADSESPSHQAAFRVTTVDSTGCGDVFHGVYAATLAAGDRLHQRVQLASAAAALKASGATLPARAEVERFANRR